MIRLACIALDSTGFCTQDATCLVSGYSLCTPHAKYALMGQLVLIVPHTMPAPDAQQSGERKRAGFNTSNGNNHHEPAPEEAS